MLKVKVKEMPVFYAGARYEVSAKLEIKDEDRNDQLFEVLEQIEENPYKGVKETTLKKALTEAGVEIPEDADRDALIELIKENNLSV